MKKKIIIIILILILAIFFRTSFLGDYVGVDAYYHNSVVKQSLEKGQLSNHNDLEYCYKGAKSGHPVGYYLPHYIFAKLFGVDAAFYIIPIIFGLFSIILAFFLVKKLFNKRTAYFTIFFMAISVSFISKTLPRTFRGDTLVYPFLLAGLLLSWIALHKKNLLFPLLSGLILGLSSFFWNGYMIVIICVNTAIFFFMFYNYFNIIKKKQLINSIIILTSQSITIILIAFLFMSRHLKGFIFATKYLPYFNLLLIAGISVLHLTQKFNIRKKLSLIGSISLFLLLGALMFKEQLIQLAYHGMGSLRRDSIYTVIEMTGLDLSYIYTLFGILSVISLIGFFLSIRKFSENKAYFLGASIPALYVAFSATRFVFFSSFFVLCFSAIAIDYFLCFEGKKKKIALIFVSGFLIAVLIQSVNSIDYFTVDKIDQPAIDGLKYFGQRTPKRSCLISPLYSAIYYYSDRYGYLPTLGGEAGPRAKKYTDLVLGNKVLNFSVDNLYITIRDKDIIRYWTLNKLAQVNGLDGSIFLLRKSRVNREDHTQEEYLDYMSNDKKYLLRRYNDRLEAYKVINNKAFRITHVFDYDKEYIYNSTYGDCFYTGNYSYYLNEKMCNTIGFRMLVGKEIKGMKKWYSAPTFKIYRLLKNSP